MDSPTAVIKWMNSRRGHKEMIMSSVPSVRSVVNSLHTFKNRHKIEYTRSVFPLSQAKSREGFFIAKLRVNILAQQS
jgi:16S rRNA C967 or C1407 C5-methylase (RsmB/RsmF family)